NSQANVRIVVEDADHHILSGAAVSIDGTAAGTTNELGSYTIPLRTAATYNFTAALDGYRTASVQKEIPFGASDPTVTILLEKEFDMTVLLAGLIGLVALGVVFVGVRKVYGDRRGKRPRRRLG
ncbi:MAG: carboxypeptidase-like regulatory domain-containing protein, partial [Methanomicrobiales archaeon]|nr:carboxypeptidase-like regulatory domain-containing protein [Methanomicrobiales archaeon]